MITKLYKNLINSLNGLKIVIREKSFVMELILGVFLLPYIFLSNIEFNHKLFLLVLYFLLLATEIMNTAVEKLEDNTELRIKYLLKRISKKELTKQIIKRNIDYKKKVSILNIYDLIRNVSIEIFNTIDKIHVNVENEESCKSFITDIMDKINNLTYLRNYCNEQLMGYSLVFSSF